MAGSSQACTRDCEERVERLADDLNAVVAAMPSGPPSVPDVIDTLEVADGIPPEEPGYTLTVERDGTAWFAERMGGGSFDGGYRFEPGGEDLAEWLDQRVATNRSYFEEGLVPGDPHEVLYLWVDRSSSSETLDELAEATPDGLRVKVFAAAPRVVSRTREQKLLEQRSVCKARREDRTQRPVI